MVLFATSLVLSEDLLGSAMIISLYFSFPLSLKNVLFNN